MKKTVFLFALFLVASTTLKATKASSITTHQFTGFDIIITAQTENYCRGFTIEKTGLNSYYVVIQEDDRSYSVNGVIEYQEKIIVYGYAHVNSGSTYYDAFIMVFDEMGTVILDEITDYGALEEVKYAFTINDILIFNIPQSVRGEPSEVKVKDIFVSYDTSFNVINQAEVINDFMLITQNDSLILLNDWFDDTYEYGVNSDLTIINKDYDLGITENQIFQGSIYLEFINQIRLNDNTYVEPFLLDYPGNYELTTNNLTLNFVIEPIVTGVSDNLITNEDVTINVNKGNLMLNNDLYVSGETISTPGNYEFIINGANDYLETYNFVITSDLTGITNNIVYSNPVTLEFNGDGYINNQYISSGEEIYEEGEYILKISGTNNYLETYFFTIENEDEETSLLEIIQKADIFILIAVLVGGTVVLKKSKKSL